MGMNEVRETLVVAEGGGKVGVYEIDVLAFLSLVVSG